MAPDLRRMGRKYYQVPTDQSVAARRKRLYLYCGCPIHGGVLSQADAWYDDDPFGRYTIVACSRNDCTLEAKAYSAVGPWELPAQFAHLIEESPSRVASTAIGPEAAALTNVSSKRKSKSRRKIWPIPQDQSLSTRTMRVNRGLCPVHGEKMTQVDGWFLDSQRRRYTVVGCWINDCRARARMYSMDGAWQLLEDCADFVAPPPACAAG